MFWNIKYKDALNLNIFLIKYTKYHVVQELPKSDSMQWGMQYAIGTQYAVGVSEKKVNSHNELSKYGWWGPLPLVQKGQTPHSWGCSTQ